MPKQPTAYYRPSSIDEALNLLRQPNTVPLAGGTTLLATEEGIDSAVVDLQDACLNALTWADDGRLFHAEMVVRLADLDGFLAPLTSHRGGAALLRPGTVGASPTHDSGFGNRPAHVRRSADRVGNETGHLPRGVHGDVGDAHADRHTHALHDAAQPTAPALNLAFAFVESLLQIGIIRLEIRCCVS